MGRRWQTCEPILAIRAPRWLIEAMCKLYCMPEVHDLPPMLRFDQWARWTDGTPEEAFELVQTCPDLLQIDRLSETWFKARDLAGPG